MRYLIVVEKTETAYSAYSPDLPGCVATGATPSEVEQAMPKQSPSTWTACEKTAIPFLLRTPTLRTLIYPPDVFLRRTDQAFQATTIFPKEVPVMKSQSVLMALAFFVVFTSQTQAASLYIRLTAATVTKQPRTFEITVDRFKDDKKGEYLRFNVEVKAKAKETPLSPFLATELEVFDGQAVVSSSLLQGIQRDGKIFYSFLVAAKYVRTSKFTFGEILCDPDGQPLSSANNYWFYLKDFVKSK